MRDPLFSDERLAAAWTDADGAAPAACPPEGLFWDAVAGGLEPAQIERLLDHTATCAACALALSAAAAIHGESGLVPAASPERPSLWDRLRVTILRPEAALAYLVLLGLLVPLSRLGDESHAPFRAARVVAFESESAARGAGEQPPVPVEVPAGEVLVLRLFLDAEDLDAREPFAVRVTGIEETVLPREALSPEGSLDVVVAAGALARGGPLTVELRQGTKVVFSRRITARSMGPARP